MMKKILSVSLASVLLVSAMAFTANAEENVCYVEAGSSGDGSEDKPFGTLTEAIAEFGGKDGTVYVYGTYDITSEAGIPAWEGEVTVTGATKDAVIHVNDSIGIVFNGDIVFKDILFDIGKYAHFNVNGHKLTMDGGEDSQFGYMMHLSNFSNTTVEEAYTVINSGTINTIHLCGGYSTSYANGVAGDSVIEINGGTVKSLNISADAYMDNMTGISIGGNLSIVYSGGTIGQIGFKETTKPEIMGSLNFIFNNGMKANLPEKFNFPEESVAGGVFTIDSAVGGKVMPTSEIGVFELTADKGKIAKIDGKEVPNGKVTLEEGETVVEWVDGVQPETEPTEEKTEIKLTIGDAKITTNGTAKDLDVPAQLIDNRTMVPLRAIFEALGASVEWDGDTKTVTSVKGDTTVKLTVGENKLTVNGTEKALDVPGQIVENRTLVPVRAISEAFGCEVGWDAETRTVTITK